MPTKLTPIPPPPRAPPEGEMLNLNNLVQSTVLSGFSREHLLISGLAPFLMLSGA